MEQQWNKTKNARSTGCGGDDSLVYEVDPESHVGCVNPILVTGTGGASIRDELSALVVLDTDPDSSLFMSNLQDASGHKILRILRIFKPFLTSTCSVK